MSDFLKRFTLPLSALVLIAIVAAACQQLATAQLYAGKGVARAVLAECALSPSVRQSNLKSINDELARQGVPARASALDCDGDGAPDI